MLKRAEWAIFVFFALTIGLSPALYFILDRKFGLLGGKPEALLNDIFWNAGFYTHIIFGGIALLTGWIQFSKKIRDRNITLHRRFGQVYVAAALTSALAGIYIGFFATGGAIAATGFISLGVVWFSTTLEAYRQILRKQIEAHKKWMFYSYAACFAAVMLRLWLPLLTFIFGDFITAYKLVAWLCWLPNLAFVRFYLLKTNSLAFKS